jgi:hypothetical protein
MIKTTDRWGSGALHSLDGVINLSVNYHSNEHEGSGDSEVATGWKLGISSAAKFPLLVDEIFIFELATRERIKVKLLTDTSDSTRYVDVLKLSEK